MYDEGFKSIANIDISKVVVDQMTEKYRDKTGLTCASQGPHAPHARRRQRGCARASCARVGGGGWVGVGLWVHNHSLPRLPRFAFGHADTAVRVFHERQGNT